MGNHRRSARRSALAASRPLGAKPCAHVFFLNLELLVDAAAPLVFLVLLGVGLGLVLPRHQVGNLRNFLGDRLDSLHDLHGELRLRDDPLQADANIRADEHARAAVVDLCEDQC